MDNLSKAAGKHYKTAISSNQDSSTTMSSIGYQPQHSHGSPFASGTANNCQTIEMPDNQKFEVLAKWVSAALSIS